jgi:hypothetical protein
VFTNPVHLDVKRATRSIGAGEMVTAQERVGGFTDKWTALHGPFVGTCPSLVVRDAVDERFALKSTRRLYVQVHCGTPPRLQGVIRHEQETDARRPIWMSDFPAII